MKYKNAFNCKKCPQRNDENGCPLWWEIVWTNDTGGQKVNKGCILSQEMGLPIVQTIVKDCVLAVKNSNEARNEIIKHTEAIVEFSKRFVSALTELSKNAILLEKKEIKQLEAKNE